MRRTRSSLLLAVGVTVGVWVSGTFRTVRPLESTSSAVASSPSPVLSLVSSNSKPKRDGLPKDSDRAINAAMTSVSPVKVLGDHLLRPPQHLQRWSELQAKALRTKEEDIEFRSLSTSDALIDKSFSLLETGLIGDKSLEAQAAREFAIEQLRTGLSMGGVDQRRLAERMAEFITECDTRTNTLVSRLKGLARADCAALFEGLARYAPDVADSVSKDNRPIIQRIVAAGRDLLKSREEL